MSAYQRSARRLVAAVAVILGGLAFAAPPPPGGPRPGPRPAATPAAAGPVASAAQARRTFSGATTSSPISMSRDGRLVWVVNPRAATVTVIRSSANPVLRTIGMVGEPQSVALDPSNRFAFVANAAGNSVSV